MKDDGSKVFDRGIKLEKFTGLGTPRRLCEWLQQVEKISDYMGLDDKKIFNISTIVLTKKAGLWLDNINARRVRAGKEKVVAWMTLKKKLRAKYIPCDYELECYLKLNTLSQGTMSVSEYTTLFDKLRFSCDLEEKEMMKIARFIRGLNWRIDKEVKSSSYNSFNYVRNLALKFESHLYKEKEEKLMSALQRFGLAKGTKDEVESKDEEVVHAKKDVDLCVVRDERL